MNILILILAMLLAVGQPQRAAQATPPATVTSPPTATPGPDVAFQPVDIGKSPCVGVQDPQNVTIPANAPKQWSVPQQVIDPTHIYCAILTLKQGRVVIQLYPQIAPKNVNSFVFLAQQGFYDNITWHRVIPDFVAQTGDPTGTGAGSPGYNIPLEVSPLAKYDRIGVLGAARAQADDSAGSQFFITYTPLPSLDPHSVQLPNSDGYTIFGQVVEGMDVVLKITPRDPGRGATNQGDPLLSVRVVDLTASK